MTKQYIARQKVGRFSKGDTVGGLTEAQIKQLEADKIIEEVKPSAQTKPSKEVKTDG
ncbi:hypothetical protein ACINWC743_1814 [Acinetobacter sp. WC-743]|uniref:hypothetical protein n=1 Tax=Acinetobacter TaxID=469 RepID=UPI0002AEDA82|nr:MULTISPECIES: hypothetical protein [Acinetobacter]ELW90924.1 hypothetical protein ACINWC743_1814 [Acinetobacter sp. WC-743]